MHRIHSQWSAVLAVVAAEGLPTELANVVLTIQLRSFAGRFTHDWSYARLPLPCLLPVHQ